MFLMLFSFVHSFLFTEKYFVPTALFNNLQYYCISSMWHGTDCEHEKKIVVSSKIHGVYNKKKAHDPTLIY